MRLRAVIKTVSPRLLAFNGKTAAARYFDVPNAQINYGRLPDTIGRTAVYVSSSHGTTQRRLMPRTGTAPSST
jgi:hypothetical protein